jgi:hypothetical protein
VTAVSQWAPSQHITLIDNTANDARWDLWDGKVQDPMTWFSGKNEHRHGQFQVGVREEAKGKAGTDKGS